MDNLIDVWVDEDRGIARGVEPTRAPNNGASKFRLDLLVLVALGVLIFLLRLHTYNEPLERDITTYAVIAHEMLGGRPIYADLWDHKPPAIHLTYAGAELIAGYGRNSIFLINVAGALAILVTCYFAGSAAGGGRVGGIIAAVVWAVTSGDVALEGNQPNTELFLNVWLGMAFLIFLRAERFGLGAGRALGAGLLFAIASLYKPVAIAQAAALALVYLAWPPTNCSRKRALGHIALIAAVGALTWMLVFGYFWAKGSGQAFVDAVFTYNRYYSQSGHATPCPIWPDSLAVIVPLAILTSTGLVLGLIAGPRRHWLLLFAFAIGTHAAVVLPGWFFPHYYQLWLPLLAVGFGWSIALLRRLLPIRLSLWLPYAAATIACASLVILEVPYYSASPEAWSLKKYGGIFVDTERLGREIPKLLSPDQTFYEWGKESGLYFTSRRRPPSGIIMAHPLVEGPLALSLSRRLIHDLNLTRPELIVVSKEIYRTTQGHPVMNLIEANYRQFSKTPGFLLFARKGSILDDRHPPPSS
jgi:hypothetical protein